MTNFIQDGRIIRYVNAGSAITSGSIVVIGDRIGVALTDIAATTGEGAVQLEGVFLLTKTTSQAWTLGQQLFYDAGTGKITSTATANSYAGCAFVAAGSSDTTGYVKIDDARMKQTTVIAAIGTTSNLVGVDGAGSNAAPLAGTEARLDTIEAKVDALILALKVSGQMANS